MYFANFFVSSSYSVVTPTEFIRRHMKTLLQFNVHSELHLIFLQCYGFGIVIGLIFVQRMVPVRRSDSLVP